MSDQFLSRLGEIDAIQVIEHKYVYIWIYFVGNNLDPVRIVCE